MSLVFRGFLTWKECIVGGLFIVNHKTETQTYTSVSHIFKDNPK